jgi:hypothetical protein
MSEVKAYRIDECARMVEDSEPDEDSWTPWTAAQSELAALREELYQAKESRDREMLAGVRLQRDLIAAEKQNEKLVGLLKEMRSNQHTFISFYRGALDAALKPTESVSDACTSCDGSGENIELQQRLTAAEQRNVAQRGLLHRALNVIRGMRYDELEASIVEALNIKPTESGASE